MFEINIFDNGDHACVAWRPTGNDPAQWQAVADCRGFAIQRKRTRNGVTDVAWLRNRVGFAENQPAPPADQAWRWPLQRYMWWDYDVMPGDTVQYRLFPMIGAAAALTAPDTSTDDGWTDPHVLSSDYGDGISAWFNRGVVATQWVERALKQQDASGAPRSTLLKAVAAPGNPLRDRLGGLLKDAVLKLLREAPGPIYAALYELNDPEVQARLVALGQRCNLILGNGAFKPPEKDENEKVRAQLRGTAINLHDRIVGSGHFAHNKFIVFCDAQGVPESVWTGSTNLTVTGLCTQVNNGVLIHDRNVAQDFRDAWDRLVAAGNGYPKTLVDPNSIQRTRQVGNTKISSWFAATNDAQDLKQARDLIAAAKQGIMFLFFNPGAFAQDPLKATLLQAVVARQAEPGLYVRGVVNQEIDKLTNVPVQLVTSGTAAPMQLPKRVLVPDAIDTKYGNWEKELKGASSVMVHSKVVILDPFGDHPVVMTGSHNLGFKASSKNDDNLVIIEGNGALARAYAANIVAIFQEYRWRDYVATHGNDSGAWKGLEDDDTWQSGHLRREKDEMLFWVPGAG